MTQPIIADGMTDQEVATILAKLLRKGTGPTPQTPMDQWGIYTDPETGARYLYDPKGSGRIRLPEPDEERQPSTASERYSAAKALAGKLVGPEGTTTPSHFYDQAGNRVPLDKAEQIEYRPAYIRQLLAQVENRLRSPELANEEHDQLIAERERLLGDMATAEAAASRGAFGGSPSSGGATGRTVFPWEQAKDEAQTEYYRAQAEKIRQELQPEYGRMVQDYIDSVQTVQGMIERGEMQPAQAEAYMELFRENLKAALQGTDPFTIKKTQAQQTTERAKMGQEILGERLRTGTSLANTLISTLSNNLKTLGWGLRPGETINFDPFAIARTFSDEMGGGQEASGLAKQLLMGLQGGQQQATTQPTSMPQATGGWDQATGLPSSVVLGWKLLDQAEEKARQQQATEPAAAQ